MVSLTNSPILNPNLCGCLVELDSVWTSGISSLRWWISWAIELWRRCWKLAGMGQIFESLIWWYERNNVIQIHSDPESKYESYSYGFDDWWLIHMIHIDSYWFNDTGKLDYNSSLRPTSHCDTDLKSWSCPGFTEAKKALSTPVASCLVAVAEGM